MSLRITFAASLAACLAGVLSPGVAAAAECPGNANALGVARTVEIDTSGGPGFGFEQYRMHDFLLPMEVVLTFDDGPWPNNTRAVLAALAQHCVRATFFPIGKHALWHPDILKEVAAGGHTIGGHTWSHANLERMKGDKGVEEVEKGFSAVKLALGASPAPFFRFPFLRDKSHLAYLGTRNIAVFSHDVDSFDFKMRSPEGVVSSVMSKLEKKRKGIVLLHDFQQSTANAMPALLTELKAKGYKIVHMKAKAPLPTIAQWDEAAKKEIRSAGIGPDKPTSSIVRTVEEPAAQPAVAKGPQGPAK